MEIKIVESERGKKLLVVENFKYYKKEVLKSSGEEKWCCTVRGCTSKIYVFYPESSPAVSRRDGVHNHDSDHRKLQRQILSASCKRKAEEDTFAMPAKLCRNMLGRMSGPDTNLLATADITNVKRAIYNTRRRKFPALPKSREEEHRAINVQSSITDLNENFILINDMAEKLIVFCCATNLKFLCKCTTIYMDGTFSYCTSFKELFTIHGHRNGHYVPLVYCLLNNKSAASYQSCFQMLIEHCEKLNLTLRPQKIVIDFEQSIHHAVMKIWSQAEVVECRFHLSQEWWRKIQELGLSAECMKESHVGKFLKYTFGLQYLSLSEVSDSLDFDLGEM